MLEHQRSTKKKEAETNHKVLIPTHCAASCLTEEIECNLWHNQGKGRELPAVNLSLGEMLSLGKWKERYCNVRCLCSLN